MKKEEFLRALEKSLSGLPREDIEERLQFYSESIDDRMDEGKTEEEAINDIGSVDEITNQIIKETPLKKIVKEKIAPRRRKPSALEVILLILGFPLWFPLLMVGFVLILVAYLLLWILVIVSYSVEVALLGYGLVGAYAFLANAVHGTFVLRYVGIALAGVGAAILFFFICIAATKISIRITKHVLLGIKKRLVGGGK